MNRKQRQAFRDNYEAQISRKLDIEHEVFYEDYFEPKQEIGLSILAGLMFAFGWYCLVKIQILYGLMFLLPSSVLIYRAVKKRQFAFRFSKNGFWTSAFGFIYFRHIERFEFYRYIGKYGSERLKIYMKDYKKYKMDKPYLEQALHTEDLVKLKKRLGH